MPAAECCEVEVSSDSTCSALMSVQVVPSSYFNLFTGHHLKDRELEEDKPSHPLFHFRLSNRVQYLLFLHRRTCLFKQLWSFPILIPRSFSFLVKFLALMRQRISMNEVVFSMVLLCLLASSWCFAHVV